MSGSRSQPKRRQTGQVKVRNEVLDGPVPAPDGLEIEVQTIFEAKAAQMVGVWNMAHQDLIVELARAQVASASAWEEWQEAGGNTTSTYLKPIGGGDTIAIPQEDVRFAQWQKAHKTHVSAHKALGLHVTGRHDGGTTTKEDTPAYIAEGGIT